MPSSEIHPKKVLLLHKGVNKKMFIRFHQNKCSKSLLISLSKSFVTKGGMRLSSKREERQERNKKKKKR
jgi:hypothetical protein